jgi:hypothetical protein
MATPSLRLRLSNGASEDVKIASYEPVELPSVPELIGCNLDYRNLWTLSYIRNNAIKTTLLYLPDGPSVDVAVARAKRYCAERRWNFSWMEPSVVVLT